LSQGIGKGQRKKEVKKTGSYYKKFRLGKGIDGGLLVRAGVHKYSEKLILSARVREVRWANIRQFGGKVVACGREWFLLIQG